jgi:hypothetical protein
LFKNRSNSSLDYQDSELEARHIVYRIAWRITLTVYAWRDLKYLLDADLRLLSSSVLYLLNISGWSRLHAFTQLFARPVGCAAAHYATIPRLLRQNQLFV